MVKVRNGADYSGIGRQASLRVHFICGIPSDHVQKGLVTAGVIFEPSINLEDFLVDDDDFTPFCNETFYSAPSIESLFPRGGFSDCVHAHNDCWV